MEWIIFLVLAAGVPAFVLLRRRHKQRLKRRRESLHRDNDAGVWIWIGLDGCEERAAIHPDSPGGAWYQPADNSHSSGSDAGGFGDGGGGGGGE